MMMKLPEDLQRGLEQMLATTPAKHLVRPTEALSQRYRSGHGREQRNFLQTGEDVLAYAAYRLPATFAAISRALAAVKARRSDWQPGTVLDVGAGPGTALWAAVSMWPEIERATLLERDGHMLRLGQQLAQQAEAKAVQQGRWQQVDLAGRWETSVHDLVICAYVLGELPQATRESVIQRLWSCTGDTLLLLEPGTPRGFALIRQGRDQLRAEGAMTSAPCPHNLACPMPENDWCHFAQRLNRSRLHRNIKGATLAYEDEKFSYAALSRSRGLPISARVIRHPQKRGGHVHLELCTPEGLRHTIVSRSAGEVYREAQDLQWGAAMEERETDDRD